MSGADSFFHSLGEEGSVAAILRLNRPAGLALIDYHSAVLRQPSALTPGERELIAAFVSALNACSYCTGVHGETARAFGLADGVLEALAEDVDAAPVAERLKPILHYARKLTLSPSRLVQADADAVFAAGWDEQALHDAINVIALYNFMNRLLEGHGVHGTPDLHRERGQRLHADGYEPLRARLGEGG